MGNTLKQITSGRGTEENKTDDIGRIIEEYYPDVLHTMKQVDHNNKAKQLADFHRAICEIVGKMNKSRSNTQFNVPTEKVLKEAFTEYFSSVDPPTHLGIYFRMGNPELNNHKGQEKLTKEEFGKILQQVIPKTGFSGDGAKDSLIYIFGVPITALLLKQTVMPDAVSNDYFIPGITSATVLVLAKLNKI